MIAQYTDHWNINVIIKLIKKMSDFPYEFGAIIDDKGIGFFDGFFGKSSKS